jgi:hypothetical protein
VRFFERDNYENRDIRLVGREVRGNRGRPNEAAQRSGFAPIIFREVASGDNGEAVHTMQPDQTASTPAYQPLRLTAAQRKQQQKLADERQGRQDAARWVEAHHPEDVQLVAVLGTRGTKTVPWKRLPSYHGLSPLLKAKGRDYAAAFLDQVESHWQWTELAWKHATYAEGVADGRRWASTIAPADQLERLRSAVSNSGREVMLDTEERNCILEAAHGLTAWILGRDAYRPRVIQDAYDEYEEYDSDREEFKSFWQPFFAEPVDEVIDSVGVQGTNAKCKLIEPDYIRGFIDGATGLSHQLREDHLA